jgi:hypothetical protein
MFEPPSLTGEYLQALLDCLVQIDIIYLRQHPETPPLYEAGVRYRREPLGAERWRAIPHVIAARAGDCEDLGSWLTAQYILAGETSCRAISKGRKTARGWLYHILVLRADGTIEDPSRVLGM